MKHGKKYVEALKSFDKHNLFDRDEAITLVKNYPPQNLTKPSRLIFVPAAMAVMQISRSAARLYFLMEPVNRYAFLYLPRAEKQRKQKRQVQNLSGRKNWCRKSRAAGLTLT